MHRLSGDQPGPRALQQVVVELAAANAVTDCVAVSDIGRRVPHQPHAETRDRLQDPVAAIVLRVDLQGGQQGHAVFQKRAERAAETRHCELAGQVPEDRQAQGDRLYPWPRQSR